MDRSRRMRSAWDRMSGFGPDDASLPARDSDAVEAAHAHADPASARPAGILALGRLAGNGAVAGLLATSAALGAPVIQRDGGWGADYRTHRARPGALSYEEYKAAIGSGGEADSYAPPVKDASQWGGHRLSPIALEDAELQQILLPEKPEDAEPLQQRIADYLPAINTAFEMMGIDTVEAQADYLAHAAGESGELANMTEKIDQPREYGKFIGRGPVQVTWESGYVQTLAYLEKKADELEGLFAEPGSMPASGATPAAGGARGRRSRVPRWLREYMAKQAAAPTAAGGEATGDTGPAATAGEETATEEPLIPTAEVSAEDAARVAAEDQKLRDQIALMRETVAAIKHDPAAAADPKYAFLFSAAYMHWTRGVKGSGTIGTNGKGGTPETPAATAAWTGAGPEDRWVTGRSTPWPATGGGRDMTSVRERAKVKKETYERAVKVLSKKMVKADAEGGAASGG